MRSPTVRDQTLGRVGKDYLKAIHELQVSAGKATTSAVAVQLGVSDPSVSRMVKKLAALGLLTHTPYHGAKLTPAGEVLARRIVHRRELIAQYLIAFLDYPAGEAGAEADRLEPVISDKLEARITALLRDST
ncbi:MAG: metal-dependent transcriptional regulator [Chloroflexota bacterium]|nr:metal-dependent transcriptional regulator [Chloroflexota bacterium]